MSRAWQSLFTPLTQYRERHLTAQSEPRLNISVVFTSVESTLSALRQAGRLASSLGAHITLLAPDVVPYPLPLDRSAVSEDFSARCFHTIVGESRVSTTVQRYLCRDPLETLLTVLPGALSGGHRCP